MAFIERIQVETEGFLSGLDLSLQPGLNVLIGARGTGKTSILELVRYCLDAGAFTEDAEVRGREQAIAILEGGAITVTIREGEASFAVTRSASGHLTTALTHLPPCTVLAQNEIEVVGKQSISRLQLIDAFRTDRDSSKRSLDSSAAAVRSLTSDTAGIVREIRELLERVSELEVVETQLATARAAQETLLGAAQASDSDRNRLATLQAASQILATRSTILNDAALRADALYGQISMAFELAQGALPPWPEYAGEDELAEPRKALQLAAENLDKALTSARSGRSAIARGLSATAVHASTIDEQLREVRQSLELLESGIGAASRAVTELEQRQGEVEAFRGKLAELRDKYQLRAKKRDTLVQEHESLRDSVFEHRNRIVAELNEVLAPRIRVRLKRSVELDEYKAAIVGTLRGTGVHYNPIAASIAENVAPFELTKWVEADDSAALALATGLSADRASNLVRALQDTGTSDLVSVNIEDGVTLELLDGTEFKPSERLSIGQRCTVVLPILLAKHGEPLLIDQPEDHLDNAFVASTLVEALNRRLATDQFLFTTHNANIPVLGNADWVMVMESDGQKGFLSHSGDLNDQKVVDAITRLLEGGKEAFAARAEFYG